jgi:hypothetical protein
MSKRKLYLAGVTAMPKVLAPDGEPLKPGASAWVSWKTAAKMFELLESSAALARKQGDEEKASAFSRRAEHWELAMNYAEEKQLALKFEA